MIVKIKNKSMSHRKAKTILSASNVALSIEKSAINHSSLIAVRASTILCQYDHYFHLAKKRVGIKVKYREIPIQLLRDSYPIALSRITNLLTQTTIDQNIQLSSKLKDALNVDSLSIKTIQEGYSRLAIKRIENIADYKKTPQWEEAESVLIKLLKIQYPGTEERITPRRKKRKSRLVLSQKTPIVRSIGASHNIRHASQIVMKRLIASRKGNVTLFDHPNNPKTISYNFDNLDRPISKIKPIIKIHHEDQNGVIYTVFYATNRKPLVTETSLTYKNEIDEMIHYGTCKVKIPHGHKFGEIEKSWFRKVLHAVKLNFKDNETLSVQDINSYENENDFWTEINELYKNIVGKKDVLIYLHGYNNSFNDAAIRAAQIGFDLKIQGITAFFSWPSKNKITSYMYDTDIIAQSESSILHFIKTFIEQENIDKIHILAHSMGNQGLYRVLERLHTINSKKLGQIILAAPDLTAQLFKDNAEYYYEHSERTTVYISPQDKAVGMSEIVHENDRLGYSPPVTVVNHIDTVQVSQALDKYLRTLGHSYFADAEALLYDIFNLINNNYAPEERQKLREAYTNDQERFWILEE